RRLLSLSTPLTPAQQSALVSGLNGLTQWTANLKNDGVLAQQISLINDTVGNKANVSTALQALATQFIARLPTNASPHDVLNVLNHISTTFNGFTVYVDPLTTSISQPTATQVLFNIHLHAQQNNTAQTDLNKIVASGQEQFSSTTTANLQSSVDFTFAFG